VRYEHEDDDNENRIFVTHREVAETEGYRYERYRDRQVEQRT
jgi:hypothetical protein